MKPSYIKPLSITLIACLGIIVYSNTFHCSFLFDDEFYIVHDLAIRHIHDLLNIWKACPCRFVTFYSLALNYHFHQLHVFGYHIFNLAVHLASAILVWWLTLLTLSTPAMKEDKISRHANIIALFAGLVFVAHPVQTEAVTYIWQRAASMATLFYLVSLCLYVKSRLPEPAGASAGRSKIYYIGALIMAIVAMFTKEISVTLPLMILLYEISFLKIKESFNWRYLIPFLLTLLIIPATMLFTKSDRFQEIRHVMEGPNGISPMHYLLTQFRVMITYIRLVFLPVNQNLDYDYPIAKSIFELPTLSSFLFLVIILFSAQRLFSKYRLVSFSIFWFFLTLLPESSFLPQKDVIYEHRLYLPLVGYSIFLVSGMYYIFGKNAFKSMMIVLAMMIACYSVLTYQRNKVWKDNISLWNDAVGKSPYKARAHNNRGKAYLDQGNIAQAMSDFDRSIKLDPYNADAYNNRGTIYFKEGNIIQAMLDLNKANDLDPYYVEAYNNRSAIYIKQENFIQAISELNKAIEINPLYAKAYYNRGLSYAAMAYHNRTDADHQLKEYNKAKADLQNAQELGYAVDPGIISELKRVSGKGQ